MSKRNLFEYRRPVTLGPTGLLVDDLASGFEASVLQAWTTVIGYPAQINLITTDAYYGKRCIEILSESLSTYAWITRNATMAAAGKHRLLAFVKVLNYYGTTSSDYQVLGIYNASLAKYALAFLVTATGVTIIHHNTTVSVQSTPLSTGEWHKLEAESDYDNLKSRFWIDGVLVGEYTETSMIAPTIMYVGDLSASFGRGRFYWDTCMYGYTVE